MSILTTASKYRGSIDVKTSASDKQSRKNRGERLSPRTPVPCALTLRPCGDMKRKGRGCGEYCSRRRRRASSPEFSPSNARTMSMQMIGRRSISVPGCDQNFPATGSGGSSALSPIPLPTPLPPLETKGGRRRLTMARWHYVCRHRAPLFSNSLHSASAFPQPPPPSPFHLFPPTFALRTSLLLAVQARSVPFFCSSFSSDPHAHPRGSILQIAIANLPALCLVALFPAALQPPAKLLESVNWRGATRVCGAFFFKLLPLLFDVPLIVSPIDEHAEF